MKKVLCLAKYMHDLNYFKAIKNYAEIENKNDLKIDILLNIPLFFTEIFTFFKPASFTQEELKESLIYEFKRKATKYKPFTARLYAYWFIVLGRLYYSKYKKILKIGKYDTLCIWGGFHIAQKMAILAAKHLQIRVFHFENGFLPNTTVMDLKGTNFYNSVPRSPDFYTNIKPDFKPTPLIPRDNLKDATQTTILPKSYIFCPFQVALDTQVLVHSLWIKNMEGFYDLIKSLTKEFPEKTFVIKEHPSCYKKYDHLHKLHDKIIFANKNSTEELIKNAEAIITINSTVGMEGIMHGKKVITIGNAFYSGYGFAKNASNFEELKEAIASIESWEVNVEESLKFLSYLKNIYLIEGSWKKPDSQHLKAILERMIR